MTSTKKTLDYLISMQQKEKLNVLNINNTSDNNNKHNTNDNNNNASSKNNNSNSKKIKPPPVIPPSPKLQPNSKLFEELNSVKIDLNLRQIELESLNESWQENTSSKPQFKNPSISQKKLIQFGLNNNRYQYQSFISHTNINKKRINELYDDAQNTHIVTNFTDIGCPTIKNPNTKKGCWCIEEIKKQKKTHSSYHQNYHHPHHHQTQHQHQSLRQSHLFIKSHSHSHSQPHPHPVLLKPTMINKQPQTTQNQSLLAQQQQKAFNIMQQLKFLGVNQPHHNNNHHHQQQMMKLNGMNGLNVKPAGAVANVAAMQGINSMGLNKNGLSHIGGASGHGAKSTVGMIQNNLICNARTQHYTPSNRMQQIRMQQMLLNARTQQPQANTLTGATSSSSKGVTGGVNGGSILGVRQHKDTIIFSNDNSSTEPPTKRRKKSRWASK